MPVCDLDSKGRRLPALLALADGTLWPGEAFGARGDRTGEAVFNTSLSGYQEILTDRGTCSRISRGSWKALADNAPPY